MQQSRVTAAPTGKLSHGRLRYRVRPATLDVAVRQAVAQIPANGHGDHIRPEPKLGKIQAQGSYPARATTHPPALPKPATGRRNSAVPSIRWSDWLEYIQLAVLNIIGFLEVLYVWMNRRRAQRAIWRRMRTQYVAPALTLWRPVFARALYAR